MYTITCPTERGCVTHPALENRPEVDLLTEVDFKWLMAGQGCWVDSARIHIDPVYAMKCLQHASNSACDALRVCADRLRASLNPPLALTRPK